MSKSTVLLVELHMMKQRLERTDVCCRIRWSQSEQTSFWETQVSSNLQTLEKINTSLLVPLSHMSTENAVVSPACFQQGRRIGISKKKQQHSSVDTQWVALIKLHHNGIQSLWKDNYRWLLYPPQVFILAESQTSVRKTSNVPKDSHTNFLEKQKKILSGKFSKLRNTASKIKCII